MKTLRLLVLLAAACAAFAAPAQDYPNRPVRIVVPLAPAGASDILGRLVAERLAAHYKQSFIVENRPRGERPPRRAAGRQGGRRWLHAARRHDRHPCRLRELPQARL